MSESSPPDYHGRIPLMKPILTLALLAAAVSASAQVITPAPIKVVGSTYGVATNFTLTFDTVLDRLTVDINNALVVPSGATGRLTGFALDLPGFDSATPFGAGSVSVVGATNTVIGDWSDFGTVAQDLNVNGLHFDFDLGVGTGPNLNGGGGNGIDYGVAAQLVLEFTSPDITAAFVSAVQGHYDSHEGAFLAARWQSVAVGPCTGLSDAGFDVPVPDGIPVPSVPEPSTYGAFGIAALLALLAVRGRR